MNLAFLSVNIITYWYFEAPVRLLIYFYKLNRGFLHLFSLPLMLRTFFKPWKNEYREGLVGISIFMGILFKSLFIIADLCILIVMLIFELAAFVIFLAWPVIAIYLTFVKVI